MFGLQFLDIGIGMIFVYLLLSLICTALNETISGWALGLRAKTLAEGIRRLLGNTATIDAFFRHPLIAGISENGKIPSYIAPRTFTIALLDIISPATSEGPRALSDITAAIDRLPDGHLKTSLIVLLNDAGHDLHQLHEKIETWFNNAMDRVSGWYKRKAHGIILVLALVITAATNADSLAIISALSNDPALRQALVAQAQGYVEQNPRPTPPPAPSASTTTQPPPVSTAPGEEAQGRTDATQNDTTTRGTAASPTVPPTSGTTDSTTLTPARQIEQSIAALESLGIPLGWSTTPTGVRGWIEKIVGLLLTLFAISLGAPFWFDMLNKIIQIRSAGKAPAETAKSPQATST